MSTNTITEIIGFDLGDAETALSRVSATKTNDKPEEIFCELAKSANGIIKTVVGYKNNGDVIIGEAAVQCRELKKGGLHVGFKTMPERGDQSYKELVNDFVNHLFTHLYDNGLLYRKRSKVIIGHPSKWKDVKNSEPVDILRQVIATTVIGETEFELIPESRGAMVEALEAGIFENFSDKDGWALVIDIGSSTCDFTAVNVNKKRSEPVDYGEELGARLIDRAIVDLVISKYDKKNQLDELLTSYPEERSRLELFCRNAKEDYYAGQNMYAGAHVIYVTGESALTIPVVLNCNTMDALVTQKYLIEIGGENLSWQTGFKNILRKVREVLSGKGIKNISVILLTGGASRMGFVQEVCKDVFPELDSHRIRRSGKPQFTIANGLARWGRLQIQTHNFKQEIDSFCDKNIKSKVEGSIEELYKKLSTMITHHVIEIIRHEFRKWHSGRYNTIAYMESQIQSEIDDWLK